MVCERPKDLAYPTVWRRFTRTSKQDGSLLKFKIQDCPEEMFDDLMKFMVEFFMKDETWNRAIGIEFDELAVKEFYIFQSSYLKEKLVQICLFDDDTEYDMINTRPKILGFNLMLVSRKDDPHIDYGFTSKPITKLFQLFDATHECNDVFERFNATEVLGDAGLSVHPDCRGLGIAHELLYARVDMCKAVGLKIMYATFTSSTSQKVAEKCGFETYYETSYADFEKKTNFDFKTDSPSLKIMAYIVK